MTESALPIHVVIPDTQVKPGVPIDNLRWIGRYIADHFAGTPKVKIIHLGDHADMPSLSSYDKGKRAMEGRRYVEDIKAANRGFDVLNESMVVKGKHKGWQPDERHILIGNHENRITRATEADAQMDGVIGLDDLSYADHGWKVHPFLHPFVADGVHYAHFWANPMTGRPYSGAALSRLKTLGHSFTMGHQQTLDMAVRFVAGRQQRGLICGACLTPDHKVLTADLRYVPLGDLSVGDKLVSFDETANDSPGRGHRFKTGTVEALKSEEAETFAVTLSNGKMFKTTSDHLWLVKQGTAYVWRATDSLRKGTRVTKALDEWETLDSRDAGYLAGMYDGEGCYYQRKLPSGAVVAQLSLAQKPGLVLDETMRVIADLCGVGSMTHTNRQGVASLRLRGGLRNIAKVLGQIRPVRLLAKFQPEHLGSITTVDDQNPTVVSVEPLGSQTIVRVAIDAGTMIVEGYAHHNCYLHDEDYMGPQGNAAHWRGILVCHHVRDGGYDLMEVSLNYLCQRYEGVSLAQFMRRRKFTVA